MRISTCKFERQFCFLPTIGILHHLRGMYSARIAVMWLCWGISIGIVKNPHCEENPVYRVWERMNEYENRTSN